MNNFIKFEYQSLRKEIEESKQRLFLVVAGGLSVVTTANYFAVRGDAGIFSLLLPFLVLAFGLLYLSQHDAKFRAGSYIRRHYENEEHMRNDFDESAPGWERWLGANPKHRESDSFMNKGFLLIFVTYYSFSAYLAGKSLYCLPLIFGINVTHLIWVLLGVVGGIFLYFLVEHLNTNTD